MSVLFVAIIVLQSHKHCDMFYFALEKSTDIQKVNTKTCHLMYNYVTNISLYISIPI